MRLVELTKQSPINNPAFRRWFKNSKIVDQHGNPLKVYHGTAIPKTHFRPERGYDMYGAYFTPSKDAADNFADFDTENEDWDAPPLVYEVYLRIQNPLIVKNGVVSDNRVQGNERGWNKGRMDYQQLTGEMLNLIKSDGYDGVVISEDGTIVNAQEIVIFDSNQVKSVDNNGRWDTNTHLMHETNLMELRGYTVHGGSTQDGLLIAWKGYYWILPPISEINDISIELLNRITTIIGIKKIDNPMDFLYSLDEIKEIRPDVFIGTLEDNVLHYEPQISSSQSPITSVLIKKVVSELKLDGVQVENSDFYDDDINTEYMYPNELKGSLPDKLYHGTTSNYMYSIARTGLRPGISKSNWDSIGINHKKLIFGADSLNRAAFHANNASGISYNRDEVNVNDIEAPFPVIIEFTVPDKNLLVPDYDVASEIVGNTDQTRRLGYTNQHTEFGTFKSYNPLKYIKKHNKRGNLWKSTGVFGYQGRIPPKYITRVYTNFSNDEALSDPHFWGSLQQFFEEWEQMKKTWYGEDDYEDY